MKFARRVLLFAALVCAGACTDFADPSEPAASPPPAYVPTPTVNEVPEQPQTPRRLRRLNNTQMENVLADVLGARLDLTRGFLPDPRAEGYDTDATALGISDSKVDEIATAAERAAAYATTPAQLERLAPCPAGQEPATCARAFLDRVVPPAWGRGPSEAEAARLLQVFRVGHEHEGYAAGIGLVLQALLQAPQFVYLSELGGPPRDGRVTLTGPEIASQISFLLRGARPDAALLAAATAGELATHEGRERQARRLLGAPQVRQHLAGFLRAWLGVDRFVNKDLAVVPIFVPTVRLALEKELVTFLDHVLATTGGRLDDLMLADYSFPSPLLAPIYGDDLLSTPGEFTRVSWHPRRRGLLSSASFLATHALISQTNPVERGLLIRSRLFCQEIPPPPPDVLAQTPIGPPALTTRQKYEAHTTEPRCRTCHQFMDPLGFGLEEFDLLGRYRTMEGDQLIDARGAIVGTDVDGTFTGPAALADRLMKSAQFRRCFVKQLWRWGEGRAAGDADDAELDALATAFERGDHRLDELLVAVVRKPTFITRRVPQ